MKGCIVEKRCTRRLDIVGRVISLPHGNIVSALKIWNGKESTVVATLPLLYAVLD